LISIHLINHLLYLPIQHLLESLFSDILIVICFGHWFDSVSRIRHLFNSPYILLDDFYFLFNSLVFLLDLIVYLFYLTELRLQISDLSFCKRYFCFHRSDKLGEMLIEVELELTWHRIINILHIISRESYLEKFSEIGWVKFIHLFRGVIGFSLSVFN
jgi:hypothetical protein